MMSRRSYLVFTGAAVGGTALATRSGRTGETTETTETAPVRSYSYGGSSVFQQSGTLVTTTESEPNDDRQEATTIPMGNAIGSELSTAEVDWFVVDATENGTLRVEFDRESDTGVTALLLYGPDGDNLDLTYVGNGDLVQLVEPVAATGKHFVEVVDVQRGDGSYELAVSYERDDPVLAPGTPEQTPYGGQTHALPGRVQSENFDDGGEGVAYHDDEEENRALYFNDDAYRAKTAVETTTTYDETGGHAVGWTEDGEWMEYTVDVAAGTYDVAVRVASPTGDHALRLSLDGVDLGTVDVPNTGSWRTWETVKLSDVVAESDGRQTLRVKILGGNFNVDWFEFVRSEQAPPVRHDEFGEQHYGEYGYGGIDA